MDRAPGVTSPCPKKKNLEDPPGWNFEKTKGKSKELGTTVPGQELFLGKHAKKKPQLEKKKD